MAIPLFSKLLICKQGHQYETVSGFVCEAFGYIPKTGESVSVVLEKECWEEHDEKEEGKHERQDQKEKHQIYRLEVHRLIIELPFAPYSAKIIFYSLLPLWTDTSR